MSEEIVKLRHLHIHSVLSSPDSVLCKAVCLKHTSDSGVCGGPWTETVGKRASPLNVQ